jgi:two-component system sensor histidine kinase/response regulator
VSLISTPAVYVFEENVYINAHAESLVGYSRLEVNTLESWFAKLFGDDATTVRSLYELDRQHQFGLSRAVTIRRGDGKERMIEVSARRDGPHEVWLLQDVTERVASQERFRVLFEQSSTAFALYDETGFVDCNPAAVALLGYSAKADLAQRQPLDLSPPLQPDGSSSAVLLQRMENIALTQGSHRFDWVYQRAQGGEARVEVTLTPLMLSHRRVFLAEWYDIGERLRYQEGLEAARDSALAFARARSDFLATMSHEIRTPMNGVIGMTRLLSETSLSPQQSEYVDTVRACGEGLLALINDILDFSRLEAGKVQLEAIPFSVREIVEDAVSVVASQATGKGLELVCRLASDVPAVSLGDPTRIRQVLLNLLSNAVKFTSRGTVELSVAKKDASRLTFTVSDTGVGISPEALPRLFSAFSQEDNSTTRRFGGSGLGLVICKELTQLMKGAIEVESSPKGSVFTTTIPLEVHTLAVVLPDLRGHTMAILEDREASRNALAQQVSSSGVRVVTLAESPELVLIDESYAHGEGTALAMQLASEGRRVGLLRRLGSPSNDVTHFTLTTPVREAVLLQHVARAILDSEKHESPSASTYRQFNARILVAEDNPVNQMVVRGLLGKLGCSVVIANDGAKAVAAWQNDSFDLILMDCQMPDVDGFEATRRIRAIQRTPIPIIALTAGVMGGDKERCLAAGMDDFLSKPVRLEDLERVLQRLIK